LDLYLRKTRPGKSHGLCDAIISKKFHFQKVFGSYENEKLAFSNSSRLKSIFDTLHFLDGLVWTVGLTVEIKLLFRFPWHIEDTALGPHHSEHKSNVFSPQCATLIRHKNKAFQKCSPNWKNLKSPGFRFSEDEKPFKNRAFQKQ